MRCGVASIRGIGEGNEPAKMVPLLTASMAEAAARRLRTKNRTRCAGMPVSEILRDAGLFDRFCVKQTRVLIPRHENAFGRVDHNNVLSGVRVSVQGAVGQGSAGERAEHGRPHLCVLERALFGFRGGFLFLGPRILTARSSSHLPRRQRQQIMSSTYRQRQAADIFFLFRCRCPLRRGKSRVLLA